MIRLIRVELLKLRTIRVTYGLGLTAVAITALFASLGATVGSGRAGVSAIYTHTGITTVTTDTGMALVFAAVLGVLATAGEHRHTSATLTYLATPARGLVMAAKAAAAAMVGFCYGVAAGVAATAVGLALVTIS
jgi:ABC-2 type transport system permease protein